MKSQHFIVSWKNFFDGDVEYEYVYIFLSSLLLLLIINYSHETSGYDYRDAEAP